MSIMGCMDELKPIRAWLVTKKGQWALIAKETGVGQKTLQRIVANEDYGVTLHTFGKLRDRMFADLRPEVAEAKEV